MTGTDCKLAIAMTITTAAARLVLILVTRSLSDLKERRKAFRVNGGFSAELSVQRPCLPKDAAETP